MIRTLIQSVKLFNKSSNYITNNCHHFTFIPYQYQCQKSLLPTISFLRTVASSAEKSIQNPEQSTNNENRDTKIEETSEWNPIYRFRYIKHLHIISRIKTYQTIFLLVGTPMAYMLSEGEKSAAIQFAVLSIGALGVLGAFSYFSTKTVGVVNFNEKSNEIEIGHLTFYGKRQNTKFSVNDLNTPSSLGESADKDVLIAFDQISTSKRFYISMKHGIILDHEQFFKVFGPMF